MKLNGFFMAKQAILSTNTLLYNIIVTTDLSKFACCTGHSLNLLGPVVQSIVSLTTLLRRQLVKYMLTTLSNTLLFFVGKM